MERDRKRRIGPIIVVAIGAILLMMAAAAIPIVVQLMQPSAAALPPSLAGMSIQRAEYAVEAVATVNQMHAKSFPLSSAAVGAYGPYGEAMLYISGAPTPWLAERMMDEMTERIAENDTPYTPQGDEIFDGTRVYALFGQGQQHFYFQSGRLLIWLAADEWLARQALEESLQFYLGTDE